MKTLVENVAKRLSEVWHSPDLPRRGHTHRCQCGHPVFFRNSLCLACGSPVPRKLHFIQLVVKNERNTARTTS